MSVNYVKKVYFPVGVLEYISTNLLKIAVKKLNLSINFVKNELLHNGPLRILRASYLVFMESSICHFMELILFSLLVLALVKCASYFSYPLAQKKKKRIAYSRSIFNYLSLFTISSEWRIWKTHLIPFWAAM